MHAKINILFWRLPILEKSHYFQKYECKILVSQKKERQLKCYSFLYEMGLVVNVVYIKCNLYEL